MILIFLQLVKWQTTITVIVHNTNEQLIDNSYFLTTSICGHILPFKWRDEKFQFVSVQIGELQSEA